MTPLPGLRPVHNGTFRLLLSIGTTPRHPVKTSESPKDTWTRKVQRPHRDGSVGVGCTVSEGGRDLSSGRSELLSWKGPQDDGSISPGPVLGVERGGKPTSFTLGSIRLFPETETIKRNLTTNGGSRKERKKSTLVP